MKPEYYTKYCDVCVHKIFDPKNGIVCGQTNKKPNFEPECHLFEETSKSKHTKEWIKNNPVDPDRYDPKNEVEFFNKKMIGVIMIAAGIAFSFMSAGNGGYTLFIGLILAGVARILF